MHYLERIFKFIKRLLSHFSGKEFLIFLVCLATSGVFWLMKTLNETYEVEFPVPIHLVGIPKNAVMTSEMSDTARVTVRDKGFTIMLYETSNKLRPLRLNFSTYANKKTGHGFVPLTDIQKLIRQQLYSSSFVTGLKIDEQDFYFNYGLNKRVRIRLAGDIEPASDYYLAHVQITPGVATVYASRELLSKIDGISTEELNITNFDDTVVRIVRLKPIMGVKVVPATVKVTLFPDVLTEGSQQVPIVTINKPESLTVRTFPQVMTVKYSVGANVYRQVSPTDFEVYVNYEEIADHPSDKCNLYLRSHSRFARNAHLETNQVDYLIEQQ